MTGRLPVLATIPVGTAVDAVDVTCVAKVTGEDNSCSSGFSSTVEVSGTTCDWLSAAADDDAVADD